MPRITVVGTYTDGGGQFSVTVNASDTTEAAEAAKGALSPRDIEVAGFFAYHPDPSVDPPDEEIPEAEVGDWSPG